MKDFYFKLKDKVYRLLLFHVTDENYLCGEALLYPNTYGRHKNAKLDLSKEIIYQNPECTIPYKREDIIFGD